jgi:transmembrane sensor
MSTQPKRKRADCTAAEIDEAAVWIARLRAPERTANVEQGLRRWLAERPSHAAAFEIVSGAWELSGAVKRRPFPRLTPWERAGFRAGFRRATAVVVAAALLMGVGTFLFLRGNGVETAVGEQRVLTLDDGTRVLLNTATHLIVKYDEDERRVELKSGEALFEVAKQPERPFVVVAGASRITALGTSFVVRDEPRRVSVILMEGKVSVAASRTSLAQQPRATGPVTLVPGQRLTLDDGARARIDEPAIERITAWRRGQLELEEMPLADAVAEMNRYSPVKLVVENPEAAALRINGVFRAGDAAGFAAALTRSYGLGIERREKQLVLTGKPHEAR